MDLSDLTRDLESLRDEALASIGASHDVPALEAIELDVLGKKGRLTGILRGIGALPGEDRPRVGAIANEVRTAIEVALTDRGTILRGSALTERLAAERVDVTTPGRAIRRGTLHPINETIAEIAAIFGQFGFVTYEGPEIEDDVRNFQMLNIPPDHPARDLWDTLYVDVEGRLLRTHTSPGQIHVMHTEQPPIRALLPGRCFRYESIDASHASEFFQVEGLMVDEGTTLADLKGLLDQFAKAMYGADKRTRFRPGYYPFTEPSVAFDVECLVCGGSGCPACSRSGWMTILGAGMVHPVVLQFGGLDPERYQGFAFGMGVERIANLRHSVGDLRLYMENDLRFLEQFQVRVPLRWLREYVDFDLAPEQLAERLTLLGMEVKGLETWGADWRNVVVGELLSVEKHPRADRLSLTRVTVDSGEVLEIVCGATNIAAGQRVPVALPGAVLPGDRRIERTEKMGVTSNGMLCSGDELGLTSDAEGILILPGDTPVGAALTELYGDTVLDVDVKPNRGDALSIVGLAREVAALTGTTLRYPSWEVDEQGPPVGDRLSVEVHEPELCPRFVGRWVSDVTVGPSPDWVQMRLQAAGIRPISNVVDASNYVMVELGKPIHTFDAAAVRDGRIVVRRAAAGERFETLDHVARTLDPDTLVIADADGPVGIAGIMGGTESEVTDATTDIIVESAIFDPINIRRSAFRYALRSDASLRFEKGQEWRLARIGADRTTRLLTEWAGGTAWLGAVDSAPADPDPVRVAFRPARTNRLLGTTLDTETQRALLERVGIATAPGTDGAPAILVAAGAKPLEVAAEGEVVQATVPTWRRDLAIEADIIEEVARIHGYELVPSILPHTPMPHFRPDPLEVRDAIRETLAGAGVTETVTFALVAPAMVERFPWRDDGAPTGEPDQTAGGAPVVVSNPLSALHSVMRQSLLGSLLEVVATNLRHGRDDVAIFEIGKGYGTGDGPDGGTREWWRLGFALTGDAEARAWNRAARPYDLDDAKGLVESIGARLRHAGLSYAPLEDDPNLHPGRAALIRGDGAITGRVGELHPSVLEALELRAERVIVGEIAVAGLAGGRLTDARAVTPSRHPDVERDLAVVVSDARPAADVAAAIARHGGPLLRSVTLFDSYRGRPLADDERSLAFRLVFAGEDRTLTEAEVADAVEAVTKGLATDVEGRIRA